MAEFLRQLGHADHPIRVHDRHALDQVGQLAHVARPVVAAQRHDRGGVEADGAALLVFHAQDEFVDQHRDVLHPLAQRGHLDGEYVEPVEEIFPETVLGDHLFQVLVRRGNDAHVRLLGLVATDALEGALLQHAQQLDLHGQRHVADFIEEQGAALGQLEAADAAGDRTSEGALLVAEQFAFQQLGRNRPAVDRHEGRATTLGVIVQIARHDFLAGAGLTEDQHAGLGVRHLLHHLPHILDGPAGADQAAEQVGLALPATLAGLVVHLAVDLGAVQGVVEPVVADRVAQHAQHATALLLGPLGHVGRLFQQHQRQQFILRMQLPDLFQHAAAGIDLTQQHAKHVLAGDRLAHPLAAVPRPAGQ